MEVVIKSVVNFMLLFYICRAHFAFQIGKKNPECYSVNVGVLRMHADDCITNGRRQTASIFRFHQGRKLDVPSSAGSRISVSVVEGGRCHQLVINDVQLSDAGQYAIIAAAAVDHVNDSRSCLTAESSGALTVVISSAEGLFTSWLSMSLF